jgi:SAM-dependent methyltransferase
MLRVRAPPLLPRRGDLRPRVFKDAGKVPWVVLESAPPGRGGPREVPRSRRRSTRRGATPVSAAGRWASLVAQRGDAPDLGAMAERLARDGRADMGATPAFRAVVAALGPARTVLDIGAGTGRYTLPLALAGCRVEALEPSPEMRARLEAALAAAPPAVRTRVRVSAEAWPAPPGAVPQVEVAFASLVIHFCADAPAFVRGMSRVAERRCVLAIRADQHHPVVERLWPRFHPDRPHPGQPVAADLLAVLGEMGIDAEVQLHEAARPYGSYPTPEDALRQLARLLRLEDAAEVAALRREVSTLLRPHGDGWRLEQPPVREALITWTP